MHLSSGPLHPGSRPSILRDALTFSFWPSCGRGAKPTPFLGGDVVHHPVAADAQPPSVRGPVGERPGRAGLIGESRDRVEHLTDPVGVVAEEPGCLVNRLGLPDELAAQPARPSRRSASSCGTYEVCPAASRARQSASAALSSASSSSCTLAACSRACKRRKSDTGTTTAAWPPRWITSYDPVSGSPAGIPVGWLGAHRAASCMGPLVLCCPSWHACGPARCHATGTAPGCCLIPLESPSEDRLTAGDRRISVPAPSPPDACSSTTPRTPNHSGAGFEPGERSSTWPSNNSAAYANASSPDPSRYPSAPGF